MSARSVLEFSPGPAGPLLADGEGWWTRAACKGTDPELFFADPEHAPAAAAEAKAVCAACPVRVPCLAEAVATGEDLQSWLSALGKLAGLAGLASMQDLTQLKPLDDSQELMWLLQDGPAATAQEEANDA